MRIVPLQMSSWNCALCSHRCRGSWKISGTSVIVFPVRLTAMPTWQSGRLVGNHSEDLEHPKAARIPLRFSVLQEFDAVWFDGGDEKVPLASRTCGMKTYADGEPWHVFGVLILY